MTTSTSPIDLSARAASVRQARQSEKSKGLLAAAQAAEKQGDAVAENLMTYFEIIEQIKSSGADDAVDKLNALREEFEQKLVTTCGEHRSAAARTAPVAAATPAPAVVPAPPAPAPATADGAPTTDTLAAEPKQPGALVRLLDRYAPKQVPPVVPDPATPATQN